MESHSRLNLEMRLSDRLGSPEGWRRFPNTGQLIQMFVEVFLKERLEQNLSQLRDRDRYNLLLEITAFHAGGADEENILLHAKALGF